MAGLAVTFAVLFFLFNFNFTYGRTSDSQKNGVASRHLSNSSPAQNSLAAIFLPVENIESAPAQICGPETEAYHPKPLGHMLRLPIRSTKEVIVPQSNVKTSHPLSLSPPAAVVNFHPINRHFQLLPPFSDHLTPRHCRRRFFRPVISRIRSGGVSNGKDAALSGTNNVIRPVIYRGDSHRIPKRPVRLHEHRRHYDVGAPKVLFKHRHEFQNENPKKRFRHDDEKPKNEKRREEKKSDAPVERKEGRLTKRIRKFLNQF